MSKPIVIFGTGKIAEVISYYAENVCGFNIAGYTVNKAHKQNDIFLNKPVVDFEQIQEKYPSSLYDMFIAVGYHDINQLRADKYAIVRALGYQLVSIISPKLTLPKNIVYGDNCFIMPPSIIHPCVKIGNNVFVWSGAMIGHHSIVGDNCWLTSSCNIGGNVVIGHNCFIALNATVSHSVKIGDKCFLGANTLVIKNLEDNKVVIAESHKPIKLSTKQFLKLSNFSSV